MNTKYLEAAIFNLKKLRAEEAQRLESEKGSLRRIMNNVKSYEDSLNGMDLHIQVLTTALLSESSQAEPETSLSEENK